MSAPIDPELVRRAWSVLTVRVAWELVRGGVQVRPPTLRAARDHAIWRLTGVRDVAEAEARAARATEEFLARADGRWDALEDDPDLGVPARYSHTVALLDALETEHEAVFRLHHADGMALEEAAPRCGLDLSEARAAREAIREVARQVLTADHPAARSWESARLDRWISRVAGLPEGDCPGPGGLITEAGRAHAERCPRCSKALRLLREGMLGPADLAPPEETGVLPIGEADLACILVHPDARRHVRALARAFGSTARVSAGGDEILVHAATCPELEPILLDAAERDAPGRAHMRVARMQVRGRWTRPAPIGPGLPSLRARAASLAWGEVSGVAPLPEPLPPPPSMARWWLGAAVTSLAAILVGTWACVSDPARTGVPLEAQAVPGGVRFDTDDLAWAFVAALGPSGPSPVLVSARPADKGALATGDGAFVAQGSADRWLIVAANEKLDDFVTVLRSGPVGESGEDMAARLQARWPAAHVEVVEGLAGAPPEEGAEVTAAAAPTDPVPPEAPVPLPSEPAPTPEAAPAAEVTPPAAATIEPVAAATPEGQPAQAAPSEGAAKAADAAAKDNQEAKAKAAATEKDKPEAKAKAAATEKDKPEARAKAAAKDKDKPKDKAAAKDKDKPKDKAAAKDKDKPKDKAAAKDKASGGSRKPSGEGRRKGPDE
jgi:hypothetical protein